MQYSEAPREPRCNRKPSIGYIDMIMAAIVLVGAVYAGRFWERKEQRLEDSTYQKCHDIAAWLEADEEDMGSKSELPTKLRVRCFEMQNR